jgi:UDP-N-acetylmuramate dehydrogenase
VQDELSDAIGAPIRKNAPLAEYTTIRIGGPAHYLCVLRDASQVARALATAAAKKLPVQLLGHGSNVLFGDEGFPGLVVVYRANRIVIDGQRIWAEGGASYARLAELAARQGLAGLAFAAGIPGTVGGALYGNAGAFGWAIGDRLAEAVVVDATGTGRRRLKPEELDLAYRSSRLSTTGEVVESVALKLDEGDTAAIWQEMEEHFEHRSQRLPPVELPSAGSFFRNLPPLTPGGRRQAAGQLLDQCGCRGLAIGDAAVYENHANIVVNQGRATAKQVLALVKEMQRRVQEQFGVTLEPEVKILAQPG